MSTAVFGAHATFQHTKRPACVVHIWALCRWCQPNVQQRQDEISHVHQGQKKRLSTRCVSAVEKQLMQHFLLQMVQRRAKPCHRRP